MSGADPFAIFNSQKIKKNKISSEKKSGSFINELFADTQNKSSGFIGMSLTDKRINTIFIVVILFIFLILCRSVWLQVMEAEYYKGIAEGNRIRIIKNDSVRGVIYDSSENLLAENIANFELVVIPVDLPQEEEKRNEIVSWLMQYSNKPEEEIRRMIFEDAIFSYEPVTIEGDLAYMQAMKAEVESSKFPGSKILVKSKRHYLLPAQDYSFSHILGYLGSIPPAEEEEYIGSGYNQSDLVGKEGIEKYYENILRGKDGKEKIEVDAFGNQKEIISKEEAIDGSSLVLSIDSDLQRVAKDALLHGLRSHNNKKGAVIILDPQTGAILALVSLPTFNNNDFVGGISYEDFNELINNPNQPLFNRAIAGQYPSGSTIKPIVAIAALEENIINNNSRIYSTGGISVDKWFYPDWKEEGHGWTDVRKALAESVNTFFYLIGGGFEDFKGLGLERLTNYLRLLGLGSKLDVDLPNEATGLIPTAEWKEKAKGEPWYIGDTYHLAIGQGDILVTPLQVASWTSFLANYGKLYQPYLVQKIMDAQGNTVKDMEPKAIRQDFVNEENIILVRQGLRQAVTSGSARALLGVPISSAGKTGTAQWSSSKLPHAWFTGFAPYQNPEIVVTVLIEEGGEGSATALPVAAEIFNWWADNR